MRLLLALAAAGAAGATSLDEGVRLAQEGADPERAAALLLAHFDNSAADAPADAEGLFWAGWALRARALGRVGDAAAADAARAAALHGRAVFQAPHHAESRFYWGDALADAGRPAAGASAMAAALFLAPDAFDEGAATKLANARFAATLRVVRPPEPHARRAQTSPWLSAARVYDDALPSGRVDDVLAAAGAYARTLGDGAATSFWVAAPAVRPGGAAARATVFEGAIAALYDAAAAAYADLADDPAAALLDFELRLAGCEYWVRAQHADRGQPAHYDLDVAAARAGAARSPALASVVYLGAGDGGATFILEKRHGGAAHDPAQPVSAGAAPETAAFVYPRRGRFAAFDGASLHGVLPARVGSEYDDDEGVDRGRTTLLVNWWFDAAPAAPNCARPPEALRAASQLAACDADAPAPPLKPRQPAGGATLDCLSHLGGASEVEPFAVPCDAQGGDYVEASWS
ncbi:hypothetical protein M885DRAFT_623769 [Pelagophyceae sp. CCMP2097]|nr:hypothetical protein M885DRAFT_623769 [Pelagophyceae sp. CCMP2097]